MGFNDVETFATSSFDLLVSTVKGCICKQVQRVNITDPCELALGNATLLEAVVMFISVFLYSGFYNMKTNTHHCCGIGVVDGEGVEGVVEGRERDEERARDILLLRTAEQHIPNRPAEA